MSAGTALVYDEILYTVRDGLRLYARRYPAASGKTKGKPALCLPGLTRNSKDFDDLARTLATDSERPRDVHALDFRGRGKSEFDRETKNYTVAVEMLDVIDYMTMSELQSAAFIGTSRGGLVTMLMAAAQPQRIASAILNDIGPVLEAEGLARIAGYVGRTPLPKTWADAARTVLELFKRDFPKLDLSGAEALARQLFNEENGRPAPGYDPEIAKSIKLPDGPLPTLWPQFEALKHAPCHAIRGENSDLLSEATIAEMQRKHPRFSVTRVTDEGHAPLLKDAPTIAAISAFLKLADDAPVQAVQAPAA